ncbi:LCP family protein [Massilistercora timonensis]|uniref:LCP family protein n=1 Tax=Massilistercora timonensis TaxID=2086584 RepID=UPI003AB1DEE8
MARKKQQLKAVRTAKARKKRRNRRRRRAVLLAFEIIILMLLLGTAYVMAKYDKFQTVTIDADDIEINEGADREGYTTVALFGGDSRDGQLEAGTHADTIIIAAIDNSSKEIRMASVYRDTLLEQMDQTYHKANQAYFRGGPTEAINMLNKNLDLDIENYVTVDFKAMSDVVDLLGGIEINVTDAEAEMLNHYVGETAKAAGKKANKLSGGGVYNLDGPQAVTYARLRKLEGGDFKRTERQRVVIERIFEKAVHMDLATVNEIIDTVFPQVSTSFSLTDIIGLASGAAQYKLGDNTGFPFEKADGSYQNAGSVVIAQGLAENVEELHEFLYPKESSMGVSGTVQQISDNIAYLTGVVRPAGLDQETSDGEEETTSGPVITDSTGNQASGEISVE